ncbi:MAG: NADP-dependent oxidoreductase [Solirubrobacteraceae bacterium]|nr:NADP-dependent oxidoreductase [Solirubrobacteraceae bacterium]
MKAVKFDRYGTDEVLEVREVDVPEPGAEEVLVKVRAAGINPGEIAIRSGVFEDRWPATFPSGLGSDFAGVVERVGEGVSAFAPGDEVLGWVGTRSSFAEYVVAPAETTVAKPEGLAWEVAGSLFVAPMAGYAAITAVAPKPGETVVVSGAAGGAGGVAAQLAVEAGARVIGLASERNHEWLRSRGIIPIAYGDGQEERVREAAPDGVDALADTFGGGYTDLGIALGVSPERISTIFDFDAGERLGVQVVYSTESTEAVAELATLLVAGRVEIPIQRTYPLEQVRDAFKELSARRTRGKLVLIP